MYFYPVRNWTDDFSVSIYLHSMHVNKYFKKTENFVQNINNKKQMKKKYYIISWKESFIPKKLNFFMIWTKTYRIPHF